VKALLVLLRFVSRPELASRPVRSLLMIGTVAVGVALLTAMHISTESIVSGFAGDLERLGGKADLQVTFGTGETGFSEDLLEKVRAQPFVRQAAALIHSQVTFVDSQPETVELFGIDLLQDDVLALYEVEVLQRDPGDFQILDDPRGIFLTDVIAKQRGLSLGSKVRLSAVDGTNEYTVHGIIATKGLAAFLGGRLVAMFLPAAQPVAGRQGTFENSMVDQIDIRLKPGASISQAQESIEQLLQPGLHVDTPMQRRVVGLHTVDGLRSTLVGMSSLALLAAVFIIYASTTTMVLQRIPSMATLVTIGASPGILVRSIVVEAGLLGAIGSVAGVILGLELSNFIGEDAAAGMGLNYSLPFDAARVSWNPWIVLMAHPAGGILTAACAAYLPARRLRHVTPFLLQREDAPLFRSAFSWQAALAAATVPGLAGFITLVRGVSAGSAAMVSLGGILVIVSSVLAMLPVMNSAWAGALPVLSALSGISGKIAGENLLRALDRSLVTASAITLSVAISVGAGSLVQSFRTSVAGWYGFAGDALVSARAVTGGWLPAPVERNLEKPLRDLPNVKNVETLRVLQGQPYQGERIAVAAMSERLLLDAASHGTPVGGLGAAEIKSRLARGEGAAVSENFVAHFGLPTNNHISLATVTGMVDVAVVAIVPDYVSDKGSVILNRDTVATRWKDDLVNFYSVTLKPGGAVSGLAREVGDSVPSGRTLSVMPTQQMIDRVDGFIGEAFADIDTIKLLVLFLTAVGIADLVVSNVLSRRRELAVLRIVGLTDTQVIQIARLEGLAVTIAAAICGAAVGILCAWVWVHYNYPALVGYVLELSIAWQSIFISLALAAITAMLAATVAAAFALRQPALTTIRFES